MIESSDEEQEGTEEATAEDDFDDEDFELESEASEKDTLSDDFIVDDSDSEYAEEPAPKPSKSKPKPKTTPKKSPNVKLDLSATLSKFTPKTSKISKPITQTLKPKTDSKEEGKYFHETLEFLQPHKIKDKNGNRPSDENYDPTTLHVPEWFYHQKGKDKPSPMILQFFKMKEDNFDVVFMFKVGKFYEFYHMDAEIGINCCGLNKQNGTHLKCGTPEMAFDRNQRVLIEAGYKVARVEQTEPANDFEVRAKKAGGKAYLAPWDSCVRREICGIATAGTIASANAFEIEEVDRGLAEKYFFAIYLEEGSGSMGNSTISGNLGMNYGDIGVCFLHTGRGEFNFYVLKDDDRYNSKLLGFLSQYEISHMICPDYLDAKLAEKITNLGIFLEHRPAKRCFWNSQKIMKYLKKSKYCWMEKSEAFQNLFLSNLDANPETQGDLILPALGGIIEYFDSSKLAYTVLNRPLIQDLRVEIQKNSSCSGKTSSSKQSKMIIDATSQKNLDLVSQLLPRINYTKSEFDRVGENFI